MCLLLNSTLVLFLRSVCGHNWTPTATMRNRSVAVLICEGIFLYILKESHSKHSSIKFDSKRTKSPSRSVCYHPSLAAYPFVTGKRPIESNTKDEQQGKGNYKGLWRNAFRGLLCPLWHPGLFYMSPRIVVPCLYLRDTMLIQICFSKNFV